MTSYFIPAVAPAWGDTITSLWAAEMLRRLCPDAAIILNDSFSESGNSALDDRYSNWIEFPWAQCSNLSLNDAGKFYDRCVATHHRHCLITDPRRGITGYKNVNPSMLTFFDAHGLSFRMIRENVYPTFKPKAQLQSQFSKLGLPADYVAIHVNSGKNDATRRNVQLGSEYLSSHIEQIKTWASERQIVTTGEPIPDTLLPSKHISKVPGWVKLCILIKASECLVSLSGFTSIASMYRKRRGCTLVNDPGPAGLNMGPPSFCYSNHEIVDFGSVDKLAYAVSTGKIKNARGRDYYLSRCMQKHWCQYETFDVYEFGQDVVSQTWKAPASDVDYVENCPVPLDAKYKISGNDKIFDLRFDRETTAIPMGRPRKK